MSRNPGFAAAAIAASLVLFAPTRTNGSLALVAKPQRKNPADSRGGVFKSRSFFLEALLPSCPALQDRFSEKLSLVVSFNFRLAARPSRKPECQSVIALVSWPWLRPTCGASDLCPAECFPCGTSFWRPRYRGIACARQGVPASKKRRRGARAIMQLAKILFPSRLEVNRVVRHAQICNQPASGRAGAGNSWFAQNVARHDGAVRDRSDTNNRQREGLHFPDRNPGVRGRPRQGEERSR